MKEEAEILFQQEINSKNKERHNLRSKTGSKGSSHSRKGVRTAYDYMSPKERKKLNGAVEVSSLYDVLQNKEWFEGFPLDKRKEILTHWRNIYPNKQIMEALEVKSQGTFNKLLQDLGVEKKRTWKQTKERPQPEQKGKHTHQSIGGIVAAVSHSEQKEPNIISFDGLHLNYNGQYSSEQLARIFTKLQLIIEGEEIKYGVSISIKEV